MTSQLRLYGPTTGVSDAGSVLGRAGVHEGQPFALAADGSYDVALNRFLRELPSWVSMATSSLTARASATPVVPCWSPVASPFCSP